MLAELFKIYNHKINFEKSIIILGDSSDTKIILENLKKKLLGQTIFLPRILSINAFWEYISPFEKVDEQIIIHILYQVINKKNISFPNFYHVLKKVLNDFSLLERDLLSVDILEKNFFQNEILSFQDFKCIYENFYNSMISLGLGYKEFFIKYFLKTEESSFDFEKNIDNLIFVDPISLSPLEKAAIKKISEKKNIFFVWNDEFDFLHNEWSNVYDLYQNLKNDSFWQIKKNHTALKKLENKIEIIKTDSLYVQLIWLADYLNSFSTNKKIAIIIEEVDLIEPLIQKLNNDDINISITWPIKFTKVYSLLNELKMFFGEIKKINNDYSNTKNSLTKILKLLNTLSQNFFEEKYFNCIQSSFSLKCLSNLPKILQKIIEFVNDNTIVSFLYKSFIEVESFLKEKKINLIEADAFLNVLEILAFWQKYIPSSTENFLVEKIINDQASQKYISYKKSGEKIFIFTLDKFINQKYDEVIFFNLDNKKHSPQKANYNFFEKKTENLNAIYSGLSANKLLKIIYLAQNVKITNLKNTSDHKIILQLKNIFPEKFSCKEISFSPIYGSNHPIFINKNKDSDVKKFISEITNKNSEQRKKVSPSMINTYLDCPLKFYFIYIKKLSTKKNGSNMEKLFGVHLHEALFSLYKDLSEKKKHLQKSDFYNLDSKISQIVTKIFSDHYLDKNFSEKKLDGEKLILKKLVEKSAKKFIEHDKKMVDQIEIIALENFFYKKLFLETENIEVTISGKIDRVEKDLEKIKVIDYKSGAANLKINSIENLFDKSPELRNSAALQLFIYAWLLSDDFLGKKITPHIFSLKEFYVENFQTDIQIKTDKKSENLSNCFDFFPTIEEKLKSIIEEIVDEKKNFEQTENKSICSRCPFEGICCG